MAQRFTREYGIIRFSRTTEGRKESVSVGCGLGWLYTVPGALILTPLVLWLFPNLSPFSFLEFFVWRGTIAEVAWHALPAIAWGVGLTALTHFPFYDGMLHYADAEKKFRKDIWISVRAGVREELWFRWLLFFSAMIVIQVSNWVLLGFAGHGLLSWLHLRILGPVANFFTFGHLEPWLLGTYGWAVGAAMLVTNGRFRRSHIYLGCFGWVNSWFFGLYMYWIMYRHGIFAAMIIHFLYDFLIFLTRYLDRAYERWADRRRPIPPIPW